MEDHKLMRLIDGYKPTYDMPFHLLDRMVEMTDFIRSRGYVLKGFRLPTMFFATPQQLTLTHFCCATRLVPRVNVYAFKSMPGLY